MWLEVGRLQEGCGARGILEHRIFNSKSKVCLYEEIGVIVKSLDSPQPSHREPHSPLLCNSVPFPLPWVCTLLCRLNRGVCFVYFLYFHGIVS